MLVAFILIVAIIVFFILKKLDIIWTPSGLAKAKSDLLDELLNSPDLLVKERIQENKSLIEFLINENIKVLKNKQERLIYIDEYGDHVFEDWHIERDKFIKKKLVTFRLKCTIDAQKNFDSLYSDKILDSDARKIIHEDIELNVFRQLQVITDDLVFDEINNSIIDKIYNKESLKDPILFEKAVAKNFRDYDWKTKDTKRTGDQGADVIAIKDEITCIVQCKLYSKPIGNKAVQEVYSAKQFYNGNIALVVSNESYTKSARQLAGSNNVVLLHYRELSDYLDELEDS